MIRAAVALLLAGAVDAWPAHLYVVDAHLYRGQTGSGLWRPSREQAIAARSVLRRFLITPPASLRTWDADGAGAIAGRFDDYVIQVEGVRAPGPRQFYSTEGDGPRQIHIDGICAAIAREENEEAAKRQLIVFDGGACVFQALYDVASGRIVQFSINGVA